MNLTRTADRARILGNRIAPLDLGIHALLPLATNGGGGRQGDTDMTRLSHLTAGEESPGPRSNGGSDIPNPLHVISQDHHSPLDDMCPAPPTDDPGPLFPVVDTPPGPRLPAEADTTPGLHSQAEDNLEVRLPGVITPPVPLGGSLEALDAILRALDVDLQAPGIDLRALDGGRRTILTASTPGHLVEGFRGRRGDGSVVVIARLAHQPSKGNVITVCPLILRLGKGHRFVRVEMERGALL
jgi:hypothetical protein